MNHFNDFPLFTNFPEKKYSGYPFCDVLFDETTGTTTLRLAVAGFSRDNLTVAKEKNTLFVSGTPTDETQEQKSCYRERNIKRTAFTRLFDLKEGSFVEGVSLEDGILEIVLGVEVPESHKRQTYVIHQE